MSTHLFNTDAYRSLNDPAAPWGSAEADSDRYHHPQSFAKLMSSNATRLIAFLLVSQAMFLGSTFRTVIPALVLTLSATSLSALRRWQRNRRGTGQSTRFIRWCKGIVFAILLGLTLASTGLWRFADDLAIQQGIIFTGLDILGHACLNCSLLIWMVRPLRGHFMMLPLGLVVIVLCVAAGGSSTSATAQMSVALACCVGFSLASHVLLSAPVTIHRERELSTQSNRASSWLAPLLMLLTLSLLLMATSVIASGTNSILPMVQQKLQEQLQVSMRTGADDQIIGGTRYVRGSTLGTVRKAILDNPQEVALTVYSEPTPGYLRGSVYDTYSSRKWLTVQTDFRVATNDPDLRNRDVPRGKTTPRVLNTGSRTLDLSTFPLTESIGPTVELEIHNDPLKGQMVFLPQATSWLEAKSNELMVNPHGVIRLGVDVTEPYVAGVSLQQPRDPMSPQRRQLLLDVPRRLDQQLRLLSSEKWGNLRGASTKAEAISNYFQSNFLYSLDMPDKPRHVEPLGYFLGTGHAGHCEYFASATVLLLRSLDVPARYVTGYVVDEYNAIDKNWVARNRDAHAWVEAYDDETNRWFAVESTPGRQYQTITTAQELANTDGLFDAFYSGSDNYGDTFLARSFGWLLSIRITDPLMILFRVAQLPPFCVAIFLLWSKFLRPTRGEEHNLDQVSRRMLRRVDRKLRKHQIIRRKSETLYQFAARVEGLCSEDSQRIRTTERGRLRKLPEWYRQYANARYQGQRPVPLN